MSKWLFTDLIGERTKAIVTLSYVTLAILFALFYWVYLRKNPKAELKRRVWRWSTGLGAILGGFVFSLSFGVVVGVIVGALNGLIVWYQFRKVRVCRWCGAENPYHIFLSAPADNCQKCRGVLGTPVSFTDS